LLQINFPTGQKPSYANSKRSFRLVLLVLVDRLALLATQGQNLPNDQNDPCNKNNET